MTRMLRALKSYIASLKAVRGLGVATRLHSRGDDEAALATLQQALDVLRLPIINRSSAPEGSTLCGCTILADQLSRELGQPGPLVEDYRDALAFLKAMPEGSHEWQEWIPYLAHEAGDAN